MRSAVLAAFIAFALAHAATPTPARAATTNVFVYNFGFSTMPASGQIDPVINVGDTIHWIWQANTHNVRSVVGIPEVFFSGTHNTGFTFDHTFTNPGTWYYYCDIHGTDGGNGVAVGMAATVTVVPAPNVAAVGGIAMAGLALRRRRPAQ